MNLSLSKNVNKIYHDWYRQISGIVFFVKLNCRQNYAYIYYANYWHTIPGMGIKYRVA